MKHVCWGSFRTRCSGSLWEQRKVEGLSPGQTGLSTDMQEAKRQSQHQGINATCLHCWPQNYKREKEREGKEKLLKPPREVLWFWCLLELNSGKFGAVVWLMIKSNHWMFYVTVMMKFCKSAWKSCWAYKLWDIKMCGVKRKRILKNNKKIMAWSIDF